MARALILLLDSVGIGGAPDAAAYGDVGADTLGHVAEWRAAAGRPLSLPNLTRLGLGRAAALATGRVPPGLEGAAVTGGFAAATETSRGKDTPSGHWELMGVPVAFDWGYFPATTPALPQTLSAGLIREGGVPGLLGDKHASGTAIIAELGAEHLATGKPIVYTSGDSVLQIAAHEEAFGLERLYALCEVAYRLVQPYKIGRVIARPFTGAPGAFRRTGDRRDFAVPPPAPTLLEHLTNAGGTVIAVGKVGDIFARRGISETVKASGNPALFDATLHAWRDAPERSLVFTNFVDFDQEFGHRRDPAGYADALEAFDRRLPEIEAMLTPGDLAVITADHGCDPTTPGADHTRERVPFLFFGPDVAARDHGLRTSFADLGQTLARHFDLAPLDTGTAIGPLSSSR